MAERMRQIIIFGHTLEADAAKPLDALLAPVTRFYKSTREGLTCNAPHSTIRRHAVMLAAMALALIDRIDGEDQPHG